MVKKYFLIVALGFMLVGCNEYNPVTPYAYNTNPTYTQGKTEFFGAYYAGIASNTLSLTLYSDSIKLNEKAEPEGLGQFLHIVDVFIPAKDSVLQTGTYIGAKTGEAFTFYTEESETNTTSYPFAFINYFEKNAANSTRKMITGGSFTVTKSGDIYSVSCNLKTGNNIDLKGSFSGKLLAIIAKK